MAKSTRDWALQKLEAAKNQIDWVGSHLIAVEQTYREFHPEIADPILLVLNGLSDMQELITKVRGLI